MGTAKHKRRAAGKNPVLALNSLVISVVFVVVSVIGAAHPSWAASTSEDLNGFLIDVQISGVQPDSNGVYRYRDGDEIGMRFTFAENEDSQFSETRLHYQLPQGFEAVQTSGSFDVPVTYNGTVYTVHNNSWNIQNGQLVIAWNTSDPNFAYLTDSANAKVVLGVNFKLRNVSGKIQLGNGVERTFQLDTSNDLAVQKSSQYDDQSGRMHYTVTIKSTGTSTDVQVHDAISGSAIIYDPSTLKVSGNSASYNVQANGNGFTFKTPTMGNGETIVLTYDGKVDYAAFHGKVTADNSTNSVSATCNNDSNPKNNTSNTNEQYDWQLQPSQWSGISKNGTAVDAKGTSKHTVHWVVTANDKRRVSLAGGTISDSLEQPARDKTQYSSDGVNIEVVDQNGKPVETRHVTWAQLGINPASDKAWTYQVPSTDGIYSYRVTYDTITDTAGSFSDVWVSNNAGMYSEATGDQSTSSGVSVGGKEFDFNATKSVVANESTYEHTAWKIDATVPAAGYSSFVITDALPSLSGYQDVSGNWVNKPLIDSYIKDSLSITGLKPGESYAVDTSDPSKVVITFYRDTARTKPGLNKSSSDRTVSATLKTKNDPTWLALGKINSWQATHTNNATVTANGQSKNAQADVTPLKQSIAKKSSYAGTRNINGTDLPVYKFTLTLDGVNSDTFDIEDDFDTSLFSFATIQQIGDWGNQNWVSGGNQYSQWAKGNQQITWTDTDKGVTIHIPQGAIAKDNGAYYQRYTIVYYLIVKDARALSTLDQRATDHDGTTMFTNTATWNGNSTGSIVSTYTYKTVTKEQTSVDPTTHIAKFRLNLNPKGTDINPKGDTHPRGHHVQEHGPRRHLNPCGPVRRRVVPSRPGHECPEHHFPRPEAGQRHLQRIPQGHRPDLLLEQGPAVWADQ
ncbi:hypothetical protein [Bifidobacterium thermophilum]|uniref:hypothetical protein n=1 Tax=Bifidobacterium thermophilum TaxID=33905 RepID=UPI0030991010